MLKLQTEIVNENIAFLELKYGNIYGGYPNFYAIAEASLLVFETHSKRVFLESWNNTIDINIVSVSSKVNELGNTIGKLREVINLRTGRVNQYDEAFQLGEQDLDREFAKLRNTKMWLQKFFMKNMRKYQFRDLITFDGNRDLFLCEKARVDFRNYNIVDMQKEITAETNYLFSLNKLAKVINFNFDHTSLRSNNLQYRLHPIAAKQIKPGAAAYDAVRLLMVHQEFREFHDDFLMKGALLLNKIEMMKKD